MSHRTQAILIGGVFIGVLSALPFLAALNVCCCLWIVGGGGITAYLMQQGQAAPVMAAEGALGGGLAGMVGAGVYLILSLPIQTFMARFQPEPGSVLPMDDLPPEALAALEYFLANPWIGVLVGAIMMLIVGVPFAALGGVLGTVFFGRTPPRPPEQTIVPPPPGFG